MPHMVGPS
jgi:hypothetical protein